MSNLSFLSKILEKVVVNQLNTHIDSSNTSNQYQSAFMKFHWTETTLLKIHNDILASMAAGTVRALTLLDFSAAFDTIDHTFVKPPFLKSTMIFSHHLMMAKSWHWLCLTFPLRSIPLTTLFSWEALKNGSGSLGRHLNGINHIWLKDVKVLS